MIIKIQFSSMWDCLFHSGTCELDFIHACGFGDMPSKHQTRHCFHVYLFMADKVRMHEEIMTNDDNLESSLITSSLLKKMSGLHAGKLN